MIYLPWTNIKLEEQAPACKQGESRYLSYAEAVCEAFDESMSLDERVYIMGQGINDQAGLFGATAGLSIKYGHERVFDTPLSENALTGIAIGSALAGLRPIYCHNRPDFLLITMDQIVNHASKWSYMFGGQSGVPMVIWAVTGRGWGSAAQHSQTLHGLFMHIPGLKLVMPSTPYDAKGLMISSIKDENPVVILEHRWCFKQKGYVPEEAYAIPFGKGIIRRRGKDVTIVAISHMVLEVVKAAEELSQIHEIDAEVIDLRTLKPLDEELILQSLKKTGKIVIADTGWLTCGASAEIAAIVAEKGFFSLKKPVCRIALPDLPTPASDVLEKEYYKGSADIVQAVLELVK